ncbi:MAG TPA: hypothetical protein VN231_05205 [Allosphingosinicella sp.]|nr:hypothetical protein [Allosphingosinicella sp.]
MKKAMYALLAAGAALAVSAPATADNGADSVREIYEAGRCMVDRDRASAVGFLQAVPVDSETTDLSQLPDSLVQRCADGMSSARTLLLRGAIAQALFFRDFGGFGLEPRRSAPLVNLDIPVQDSPEGSVRTELYRWADCVVRNDAPHTELLLASSVGSRNESAAIERMRAFMAACAPAGAQLAVQPSELRSLLAQSAYHSMYRYWTDQLTSVRDQ